MHICPAGDSQEHIAAALAAVKDICVIKVEVYDVDAAVVLQNPVPQLIHMQPGRQKESYSWLSKSMA